MRYIILLFIVLVAVFVIAMPLSTQESVLFTVTDKERVTESSGNSIESRYIVFTDTEVFENTDCMILGKWNSSDVQGTLKVGKTYRATVYGWRVPFMSWYRNIVSVEVVR